MPPKRAPTVAPSAAAASSQRAQVVTSKEIVETDLVEPGSLPEALQCGICLGILHDPVASRTPRGCQHCFCRMCVEAALQRDARCPLCRTGISQEHLEHSLVHQEFLNSLMVRCPEVAAGCYWTGLCTYNGQRSCCNTKFCWDGQR